MSWFYTASQDAQTIPDGVNSEDQLFGITAATDKPIRLWGFDIGNTSDLQDEMEETLLFEIQRGSTFAGGTALTEVALDDHAPTASAVIVGRPTSPSTGSVVKRIWWNARQAGPAWLAATEDATILIRAGNTADIRLLDFFDAITLGYEMLWEEL